MKKNTLKKLYISLAILFVLILSLVSVAYAWMSRSGLSGVPVSSPGFSYKESAYMLHDTINVKTSYVDQSGQKVLIADGFTSQQSLSLMSILLPGTRTEFTTSISNLSNSTMCVSVNLLDIIVGSSIADYFRICAYEPDFYDYSKGDMNTNSSYNYQRASLLLADNVNIGAGETATVKWYIYLDSELEFGSFEALKVNGNFETCTDTDCNIYYYSVSEKETSTGAIKHAYLCNAYGDLVDSSFNLLGNVAPFDYSFGTDTYTSEEVEYKIIRTQNGIIDITQENTDLSIEGIVVR